MTEPTGFGPTAAREAILRVMPANVEDRAGWATDIHAALAALELPSTPENICAVIAVTEQESSFRADPAVPGLPAHRVEGDRPARRARRRARSSRCARRSRSSRPTAAATAERIDAVKTERQLSEIFEDFIGMVPLGKTLSRRPQPGAHRRPDAGEHRVRRGPCAGAQAYPVSDQGLARREVFTRRGGMYFGTAHLLAYPAPYDKAALPLRRLQRRPVREPQRRVPKRAERGLGHAARARRRPAAARRRRASRGETEARRRARWPAAWT